jgi:quinoprotein glucose dehydrogenase
MDSGAALAAVKDDSKPVDERVACLMQLAQDRDTKLPEAIDAALRSNQPALRAQARAVVARTDPARGVAMLVAALDEGSMPERQAAVAALATTGSDAATAALSKQLVALEAGTLPNAMAVDVLAAAEVRPELRARAEAFRASLAAKGSLGAWVLCEEGGDAERGRRIVNFHSAAACLRCHMVEGTGGHAAPSLAGVGSRHDRRGLVASLVDPNASVAEGFGPVSAMPAMGTMLTPAEVRDVVEYLATLK